MGINEITCCRAFSYDARAREDELFRIYIGMPRGGCEQLFDFGA